MDPLEEQLKALVLQSREVLPRGLSGLGERSGLGKQRFKKKRRNSKKETKPQ
jgi:hypothetical protein